MIMQSLLIFIFLNINNFFSSDIQNTSWVFESDKVRFKLSEPNRAGLIVPDNMSENEDITMLVMPVMLNDNA